MTHKALFFFLLMTVAAPAAAHESGVEVASADKAGKGVAPAVTEKYEYYEIKGNCETDLQSQLRRNCITWDDGKKYDSLTTWRVKWDYDRDRATCAPDSFRLTVDIVYRYPKWSPPGDAPPQLVEKWDRYMKSLITHEKGHRDMVVKAATEVSRAVAGLPPAPTCAELKQKVCALCCELMDKLKAEEKKYDEATFHGAVQGAVFP